MIKEIPLDERPREKSRKLGIKSLTDTELIAILLGSGNRDESAIEVARKILELIDKIQDLKKIGYAELKQIKGVKEAKAATILSAIELSNRMNESKIGELTKINSSHDVYDYMKYLEEFEQENFFTLLLDTKMKVISKELIYIGTVNQISIHPREVFKNAIKKNAVSMILVHNHPSGDPYPSDADVRATKILMKSAEIINISIIDHIIIGNNRFYSFTEKRTFVAENQ